MSTASLTIQARHLDALRALLRRDDGVERAAYVLCGAAHIGHDPWDRQGHRTFVSYEVVPVPEDQVVSASSQHITWTTTSFVRALQGAQTEGLTVAVVHSHPSGLTSFSAQDDRNEADLVELAQHRNGPDTPLVSLLLTPAGDLQGRVWTGRHAYVPLRLLQVVGESIRLQYPGRGHGQARPALARQALAFGTALNQDLAMLRVGVVGCGGTGSATALLLARLGVGQLALFDPDVVECTNLNRLHGARQADADALRPKVEVVARALTELGLGVRVVPLQAWIGDVVCRDAFKACDVVFGCTDDHAGRLLLNRFAYYYVTPVIDMGLAIEVSAGEPPAIQALDGRVTVLGPGHPCLLCRGVVNPVRAREEALQRANPTEYARQKAEAYVVGEGNPSPAVVTFTTEVAAMAIEEFLHRLQGFRGPEGAVGQRVRKFHLLTDRRQGGAPQPDCPVCASPRCWGRGDVDPFLDLVG